MHRISAFMDGEQGTGEANQTLKRLKHEGECREHWETFHLIGDVIRGEPDIRGYVDDGARLGRLCDFDIRWESHDPVCEVVRS